MPFFRYIKYFLFISVISSAYSQTYNYEKYSVEDGLSQSQALSILQGQKGYLWIGTNGGGVNIFNGQTFKYLTTNDGLADNVVFSICEDKNEGLYFATNNGLSYYRHGKFRNYTIKEGLPSNQVFAVSIDNDKNVWIGTSSGPAILKDDTISVLNSNIDLATAKVFNIHIDAENTVWFSTLGSGLFVYKEGKVEYIKLKTKRHRFMRQVSSDPSGENLCMATYGGITFLNKKTRKISYTKALSVGSVLYAQDNRLYIGMLNGFLARYTIPDELTNLSDSVFNARTIVRVEDFGFKIYCLIQDSEYNIWAGTEQGLLKIPKTEFYNYSQKDSLPFNNITSILNVDSNKFWAGATKNGAWRMDVKFNREISCNNTSIDKALRLGNMCAGNASSIEIDNNENIWIGTIAGITKFNTRNKKYTNYVNKYTFDNIEARKQDRIKRGLPLNTRNITLENEIYNETIFKIFKDHANTIWFGTDKGVVYYKDNEFKNFNEKFEQLKTCRINDIFEDNDFNLWFASNSGGAYFISGNKIKSLGAKDGFTDSPVISIVQDKRKNLWFGTRDGVYRYNDVRFDKINTDNGLTSNNIYLIIFDNNDNLFVGTPRGLDKINIELFNKTGEINITHIDENDGFIGQECNTNACCKDTEGKIWFGTVKGLTVYDPKYDIVNTKAPYIEISKIELNFTKIDSTVIADFSEGIDFSTNLPKKLILPYNKNHLTFFFNAIDLTNPSKVKYSYLLEGLNTEWSPPRSKNEADYPGLTDGDYTIMIKASNSDGVWTKTPYKYSFTITPPFWKTWWFYALVTIFLIIIVITYVKRREEALRKEKEILERKVKERTLEIEEQKEEILEQAAELEKLSIVASETDNAVMIMDAKGSFEWVNTGFTRMYGYTLEDIIERKGGSILNSSAQEEINSIIHECLSNKKTVIYEAFTETKSGDSLWAQTTLTPIIGDNGEVVKLVAIDSNINEMKLAEEEIKIQKEIVEHKNQEVTDSINYARNIQRAILPKLPNIKKAFPESFVLFRPRDIVSGDFYWFYERGDITITVAADCTGHGVPGAFMSMLGISFLNQIVSTSEELEPNIILDKLRSQIIKSLNQTGVFGESKDGMDMVMVAVNKETKEIKFAGANNPLYLIRENELIETKGDKMPIAHYIKMDPFVGHTIKYKKNDAIYFFSDGFVDQFGGPKGKKFMTKRFKRLLVDNQNLSMDAQGEFLNKTIEEWKGAFEQVDDIIVIGLKL